MFRAHAFGRRNPLNEELRRPAPHLEGRGVGKLSREKGMVDWRPRDTLIEELWPPGRHQEGRGAWFGPTSSGPVTDGGPATL